MPVSYVSVCEPRGERKDGVEKRGGWGRAEGAGSGNLFQVTKISGVVCTHCTSILISS